MLEPLWNLTIVCKLAGVDKLLVKGELHVTMFFPVPSRSKDSLPCPLLFLLTTILYSLLLRLFDIRPLLINLVGFGGISGVSIVFDV